MENMELPSETDFEENPYILSHTMSIGEVSFVDKKMPLQKLAPPPKYFTSDYILENFALPSDVKTILRGMEFPDNGGMVCTS